MNLLVDIGNSRIKWALGSAPGNWQARGACAHADELDAQWRGLEPRAVVACNVAGPGPASHVTAAARRCFATAVQYVHARAVGHGVINRYADPARLGADRWAALVGARDLVTGAVCVVDCGTAITVDGLDAAGHFDGGAIFPGLAMCAGALGRGTHGIGTGFGSGRAFPGRDTADAVAAGVHLGVAGALDALVARYRSFLGLDAPVLLTGGDAALLQPLLTTPAQPVPDLVLRGLAVIAAASA